MKGVGLLSHGTFAGVGDRVRREKRNFLQGEAGGCLLVGGRGELESSLPPPRSVSACPTSAEVLRLGTPLPTTTLSQYFRLCFDDRTLKQQVCSAETTIQQSESLFSSLSQRMASHPNPNPSGPEPIWSVAHLILAQGQWTENDFFAMHSNRLSHFSTRIFRSG